MTKSLKRETWQQHIAAWQQSQLSKTDYCQQHGLSRACFYKWYSKLCPSAKPAKAVTTNLPLTLIPLSPPKTSGVVTSISLHSPQGWRIDCPLVVNNDTLHSIRQLVSLLP